MSTKAGTLETLALEVARSFQTLADQLADEGVFPFFQSIGLQLPAGFADQLTNELQAGITAAGLLPDRITALEQAIEADDVGAIATAGGALVGTIGQVVGAVRGIADAVQSLSGTFAGLTPAERAELAAFAGDLARRAVDLLLVTLMEARFPLFLSALELAGIVERIDDAGVAGSSVSIPFRNNVIHFDRLSTLLSRPQDYMQTVFGWGAGGFDGLTLLGNLKNFLEGSVGIQADLIAPPGLHAALEAYNFNLAVEDGPNPGDAPGLNVSLRIPATQDLVETIPLLDAWDLAFEVRARFVEDTHISVRPPLRLSLLPPTATADASVAANLQRRADAGPLLIVGQTDGSRIEVDSVQAGVGFDAKLDATANSASGDPKLSAALSGGRGVISGKGRDGFLASIIGDRELTATFDVSAQWSADRGVTIAGGGGLEVAIPTTVTLGPLTLQALSLILELGDPLKLAAAVDFGLQLGPVAVSVEGLGGFVSAGFPSDRNGNLGPVEIDAGLRPPTGLGISVNAGPVHGGGFISFEPDLGRYSGALELSIYDISVKAFGLIETKVPGVSFSFVIVISAEFTPIQLGFGFTLNGVGGLVGINRTVNSNELGKLVREGRSEELLFPKNLIANAPTIIRDLGTVFPARQSHYIFGPLGKLGWGTPTLITGEIGIIIEIPGVVAILGEIAVLLPKPELPLVKMNMSVGGTLDFPNKTFSLDAALHDSIIEGYPISGQMALRVKWGDQPNFVASIGGFHPAYQPPKDFPKLQPMTLDLGQHGSASITVSGFFAVTSNTVQVGGDARLHAGGSGISLDASVSVKALFVFAPFHFEATIDASVKISFHGYGPSVHLSGVLEGPSPWHIRGELCVSIVFWDACLGFDETFGGGDTAGVPELDPWDPASGDIVGLHAALADAGNWSGTAPAGTAAVVSRAQGSEKLVDPVGGLQVHQKAVPVETDQPISRFGVAKVASPIKFVLQTATFGTDTSPPALTVLSPVNDFFAPAQYFEMDDGKKLSAAGFEQKQAGYVFGESAANLRQGSNAGVQSNYTTYIIGADGTISDPQVDQATQAQVTGQNKRSAVALGGVTQLGTRRFIDRLITQAFDIRPPTFILSNNLSLTALTGLTAVSRTSALLSLDAYRLQNQEQKLLVQVSAFHELAA